MMSPLMQRYAVICRLPGRPPGRPFFLLDIENLKMWLIVSCNDNG